MSIYYTGGVQKVKELHLDDMDVIVEPGIGWIELNEYLKPHGLFFPLDPGNTLLLCSHESLLRTLPLGLSFGFSGC